MIWPGSFSGEILCIVRITLASYGMVASIASEHQSWQNIGGFVFATDPTLSALDGPIFWTPSADPASILLMPAPADPGNAPLTDESIAEYPRAADHNETMRADLQDASFDISFLHRSAGAPLAAAILLDDDTPDRLHALGRFWAAMRGRSRVADDRLTPQRRQRLRHMLRAVDGRQAGATYRTIGQVLFPHHQIDAASWAGDAIRETTIRLARDGMKLVDGGYRSLLRRSRRS